MNIKKNKVNPKDKKKPLNPFGATDMIRLPPSRMDPEGWYTGLPLNEFDKPVQDADDL